MNIHIYIILFATFVLFLFTLQTHKQTLTHQTDKQIAPTTNKNNNKNYQNSFNFTPLLDNFATFLHSKAC